MRRRFAKLGLASILALLAAPSAAQAQPSTCAEGRDSAIEDAVAAARPLTPEDVDASGADTGPTDDQDDQDDDDETRCDEARERFNEALQALEEGRAAEGRDLFIESLTLCPRTPTQLNLAVALRRAGQPIEALAVLRKVEFDPAGGDDLRARATEQAALARDEVALIEVTLEADPTARAGTRSRTLATLMLDGQPAGELSTGDARCLATGPGTHRITAEAPGFEDTSRSVRAASRETTPVALTLRPNTDGTRGADATSQSGDGGDEGAPLWPWLLGIGGAVAVGVAVALIVFFATQQDERVIGSFEPLVRF